MLKLILTSLKKYAVFSGRASLAEFWVFNIFVGVVYMLVNIYEVRAIMDMRAGSSVLTFFVPMALVVPTISVSVRRVHDIGRDWWWAMVPFYNFLLYTRASDQGENRFGQIPG